MEQKIGVTPDYEKNLALVNAMQTDVKNYGERNHHGKGHHNRQICGNIPYVCFFNAQHMTKRFGGPFLTLKITTSRSEA